MTNEDIDDYDKLDGLEIPGLKSWIADDHEWNWDKYDAHRHITGCDKWSWYIASTTKEGWEVVYPSNEVRIYAEGPETLQEGRDLADQAILELLKVYTIEELLKDAKDNDAWRDIKRAITTLQKHSSYIPQFDSEVRALAEVLL